MKSPKVETISDCFIKPKFESEESNKPIYFSPWDLLMINVNYIQKGLLFPSPENQDSFSMTTFLEHLKDSLSVTLSHFHPLTGRLSTVKRKNPPSIVVYLNPVNSPGARFIHSVANVTVTEILSLTDVPLIVQSFFDHDKAINHDGHHLSLLSVQVTELIDGIFIGCSINHMIVDGTSFWHFFNSWSEIFRSKTQTRYNLTPISRPPVLKRWTPAGSDPIITLPFTQEDQFIDRPNRSFLRERIFQISSKSLSKLKSKVNSDNSTTKISTFQALSAVVWRCGTRARRLPADRETSCRMSSNNRRRLSPLLSDNYFGNSIQTLRGIATAGTLLSHGVGWAAWLLHERVVNHGDKEIREFADLWMKNPFVCKLGMYDSNSIQVGSSPRFDVYGNEFGLGKGVAVLSGYGNKFDGKVTLYEGRDGGGSMDVEICLTPENMEVFECDDEFMSLVN